MRMMVVREEVNSGPVFRLFQRGKDECDVASAGGRFISGNSFHALRCSNVNGLQHVCGTQDGAPKMEAIFPQSLPSRSDGLAFHPGRQERSPDYNRGCGTALAFSSQLRMLAPMGGTQSDRLPRSFQVAVEAQGHFGRSLRDLGANRNRRGRPSASLSRLDLRGTPEANRESPAGSLAVCLDSLLYGIEAREHLRRSPLMAFPRLDSDDSEHGIQATTVTQDPDSSSLAESFGNVPPWKAGGTPYPRPSILSELHQQDTPEAGERRGTESRLVTSAQLPAHLLCLAKGCGRKPRGSHGTSRIAFGIGADQALLAPDHGRGKTKFNREAVNSLPCLPGKAIHDLLLAIERKSVFILHEQAPTGEALFCLPIPPVFFQSALVGRAQYPFEAPKAGGIF